MNTPKPQRCLYKGNGCERDGVHGAILKFMCEGDLFFKCYEYQRLHSDSEEPEIERDYRRRFVE